MAVSPVSRHVITTNKGEREESRNQRIGVPPKVLHPVGLKPFRNKETVGCNYVYINELYSHI